MRSYFQPTPVDGHGQQAIDDRLAFAPLPSDHIDAAVLAADTAERFTVPADADFVAFSSTTDFYAKFGDSAVDAAVPSTDVTDGSASELNPAVREVPNSATHVSLIASAACVVTISWYDS